MASKGSYGDRVIDEFRKNSGWLIALGIVLMVLGALGLYRQVTLPESSLRYIGALLLGGGLFQLFDVYKAEKWVSRASHLVTSLVYLVGGLVMILFSAESSTLLVLLVGFGLAVVGVLRILTSLQGRKHLKRWVWVLVCGIASISMGAMLMAQWPWPGMDVVALFVSFELILQGLCMTYIAIAVRHRAG